MVQTVEGSDGPPGQPPPSRRLIAAVTCGLALLALLAAGLLHAAWHLAWTDVASGYLLAISLVAGLMALRPFVRALVRWLQS